MKMIQKEIVLPPYPRGFHLITEEVVREMAELRTFKTGMCQLFIRHTSAGLSLNENGDPTVLHDFETYFDKTVPEDDPDFLHTYEGPDDMPAHIKSALVGSQVLIPVKAGQLFLGRWQGIYLCEFRNHGGARHLVVTAWGTV